MFKRKPIYIILLVIFTLLLCADIVIYSVSANASSDMSAVSSSDFSGEMSEMQGDLAGEMPDMENQDFDPTEMQEGFEMPDMTETAGGAGSASGFTAFILGWWIPIGVLCVLVDAFSVFMLMRISKKRKLEAAGITEGITTEEIATEEKLKEKKPKVSGYEKRRRKKRRTMRIIIIILIAFVVVILGFIIARSIYLAQSAEDAAAAVVSAETASTEIDTVVSGTGTLSDADAEAITVPGGVEIETYYVENGDTVEIGDALASVDLTSVMIAIEELQDAMDTLDEDIEDASSDAIESEIEATVDGRIKVIYAEEDTSVTDTMYDNGALMLISLDGLMAADIETDADIATGSSVVVTLADGTEESGRVASFSGGIATITVTDDGTVYGEEVTVSDEDGNVIGSSTLYIHSELKVTGYSGTVSAIKYDENDEVSAGDTLMTLTDTEYTAEYELLIEQRSEYEEQMAKLFALYKDGNIYAEYAGTVSGIDESSTTDESTTDESTTDESTTDTATDSTTADTLAYQTIGTLTYQTVDTLVYQEDEPATVTLLSNNPTSLDDVTVAGYSNIVASVSSVSYDSIRIMQYSTNVSITDYSDYSSLGITSEMMTTENRINPSADTPVYMFENGTWMQYSVSDISAGDVLILTYDTTGENSSLVWIIIASKAETGEGGSSSESTGESTGDSTGESTGDSTGESTGTPSSSGGTTNNTANSAASNTTDSTTEETEETYTISETTVMSITPSDTMSVSITIDEMDILSMEIGQEATITLDALSNQTFTGSVTDIDMTGTNSGGSTKYTAVITLDKTEEMLAGMNAVASITLSAMECDVTIPVAALVESGSDVFVYTSYDEENDVFGDPVTITTGLSDGTNVEILSGLSSGDTVWYEYDDTVNISSSIVSSSTSSGFNLMNIFGSGGGR